MPEAPRDSRPVTYRVVIFGLVQGVSYRASMREAALRHGVQGWARNREDGTVEAVLQGESPNVEKLLEWAKSGPPGSRVSRIEKELLEDYQEQAGFKIVVPDWWEEEGEE